MNEKPTGSMSSVEKALEVLTFIGMNREAALADIAANTPYPKSTLLRLIHLMIRAGFLQRTQHGHYRATLKVWRIGCGTLDYEVIRDQILPVLQQLVDITGETAHYSNYEDGHAVYMEKIDGLHPIRAYTSVGGRSPAYASATGKALLAWCKEAEIREVMKSAEQLTTATICDVEQFLIHSAEIRDQGFSINRGEWRTEVWGIGAPIFSKNGKVEGAIGISGPEDRMASGLDQFVVEVVSRANALSRSLGYM